MCLPYFCFPRVEQYNYERERRSKAPEGTADAPRQQQTSVPDASDSPKLSKASSASAPAPRTAYCRPSAFIKGLYQYIINPICAKFFPRAIQKPVNDCLESAMDAILAYEKNFTSLIATCKKLDDLALITAGLSGLDLEHIVKPSINSYLSKLDDENLSKFKANFCQYSLERQKSLQINSFQDGDKKPKCTEILGDLLDQIIGGRNVAKHCKDQLNQQQLNEEADRKRIPAAQSFDKALIIEENSTLTSQMKEGIQQKLPEKLPLFNGKMAQETLVAQSSDKAHFAKESNASLLQRNKRLFSLVQGVLINLSSLSAKSKEQNLERAACSLMMLSFMIPDQIYWDEVEEEIIERAKKLSDDKKNGLRGLGNTAALTSMPLSESVMLKVSYVTLEKARKARNLGETENIDSVTEKVKQILEFIAKHASEESDDLPSRNIRLNDAGGYEVNAGTPAVR
jgi:hypothetical protein